MAKRGLAALLGLTPPKNAEKVAKTVTGLKQKSKISCAQEERPASPVPSEASVWKANLEDG